MDNINIKGVRVLVIENPSLNKVVIEKKLVKRPGCIFSFSFTTSPEKNIDEDHSIILFNLSSIEICKLDELRKQILSFKNTPVIAFIEEEGRNSTSRLIESGFDSFIFENELTPELIQRNLLHVHDKYQYKKLFENEKLKLVQSSKFALMGEMSAGIAHEIANPLTIILGKAECSSAKYKDDKYLKNSFEKIEKMVGRITKIVNTIRNFARNTSGDDYLTCSLAEILEDSLELCQEKLRSYSVNLKVINNFDDFFIDCRSIEISQVLINLIGNACDAIKNLDERWIEISGERVDENIIIKIKDSGIELPTELKEKMMMPFFTTKEMGKGTGLGLSISKDIIESHSGKMYISDDCANTEFVLVLPIKIDVKEACE